MVTTNKLEKDIRQKEEELLQEFKEGLEAMNEEEFKTYFKSLIDKYYKIAFTFEANYSKYYEETKQQYKVIKQVKKMLASKYNNLDNYENGIRLGKAEDIAYKYMIELHSMEDSYSNIIYHDKTQELILINKTLTNLIGVYEKTSSEDILRVIEEFLLGTVILIKEAKKLPLNDSLEDIKEPVTFKKEHLPKDKFSKEDLEELPEEWNTDYYNSSVLSIELKKQLDKFEDKLQQLEEILPEDVLTTFYLDLNSSEKINFLNMLLETKTEEETEEDIYRLVAYSDYITKENNKGYLYNIIEEWS